MRRINLLLAGAERRTCNSLEAMVLDVCYDQAVVETTRTTRVDELVYLGSRDGLQLIMVAVDHLLAEPSRRGIAVAAEEAVRAIRLIRHERLTPILAVAMSAELETTLLEAGADHVAIGMNLNPQQIKCLLRGLLHIPELAEVAAPPARWSLGNLFIRSPGRLKDAA
jgi:hypothetical protein